MASGASSEALAAMDGMSGPRIVPQAKKPMTWAVNDEGKRLTMASAMRSSKPVSFIPRPMENAPTSNHQMGLEKNEKPDVAGTWPTSTKSATMMSAVANSGRTAQIHQTIAPARMASTKHPCSPSPSGRKKNAMSTVTTTPAMAPTMRLMRCLRAALSTSLRAFPIDLIGYRIALLGI